MDLSLPTGVASVEDKDTLGGFQVLVSEVYQGKIEMMYLDAAPSGAKNVVTVFTNDKGVSVKQTEYISNAAGDFTYTDRNSGKPVPMIGYSKIDAWLLAITGKGIANQTLEEKLVNIYNKDANKELPTKRKVFMDVLNAPIAAGILHVQEEKTVKSDTETEANGKPKYYGTGEFRDVNKIDKFFDVETGLTVTEKKAGETTPAFLGTWKEKYVGKEPRIIKAKNQPTGGATAGVPNQAAAAPAAKPLFG